MRVALSAFCAFALSSCALTSPELESASTALPPSVMSIEREQLLQNLGRFIDKCRLRPTFPGASELKITCSVLPSQVVLGGGQVQVSNTLALPNATTVNMQGLFLKAIGIQNSNQWVQTWGISPVTDFGDLQRLSLLYGYAVLLSESELDNQDPLVLAFANGWVSAPINLGSANPSTPLIKLGASQLSQNAYNDLPMPLPPIAAGNAVEAKSFAWCEDTDLKNIWCGPNSKPSDWPTTLPSRRWFWTDEHDGATYAGTYSKHKLYVHEDDLQQFLRWVLGATADTSSGSGGAKGSSGILSPSYTPP